MNDAAKEIQVAGSISGHLLHYGGAGNSLDSVAHYGTRASAAAIDLPSYLSLGGSAASSRRLERRAQPFAKVHSKNNGNRHGRAEPRWHKLVRKYPTTVGAFCIGFPFALVAQVLVMVHL